MRKYIIINKNTSLVEQSMYWGDDRDFPFDWHLEDNELVVTTDISTINTELGDAYNETLGEFYALEPIDPLPIPKSNMELMQEKIDTLTLQIENAQGAIDYIVYNY